MATNRYIQTIVKLPKYLKAEERAAIAQEIITYIQDRTTEGKDVDERKFKGGYSNSYKKSLDFKVGGKTNKINLTLSGEMLAAIKLLDSSSGKIKIGFNEDDPEAGRVEGNQRGTYGQSKPVAEPRKFLGISDKVLKSILAAYPKNDEDARKTQAGKVLLTAEAAGDLVQGIEEEDLEEFAI
jgi:hypothetical protein